MASCSLTKSAISTLPVNDSYWYTKCKSARNIKIKEYEPNINYKEIFERISKKYAYKSMTKDAVLYYKTLHSQKMDMGSKVFVGTLWTIILPFITPLSALYDAGNGIMHAGTLDDDICNCSICKDNRLKDFPDLFEPDLPVDHTNTIGQYAGPDL